MSDYPLIIGSPETFATVRRLFEQAQFDEAPVARRLGGTRMFGFPQIANGRKTVTGAVEDANAALIRLLLDCEPLPAAIMRDLCGDVATDALETLGIVVPDPDDPGQLHATVMLTPVSGVWIAQDIPPRTGRLDPSAVARDVVFPAISQLTRDFLDVVDDGVGLRVLELCAGAGLGALRAARAGAAEAWASDITDRSVYFARWNAALNGLDDVHSVASDVWNDFVGETFDRVIAHPPYVPALSHMFDFRDGGADGEQITRRIVQGLPTHLRAGGRCSITAALTDRRDDSVQHRIREWLGDAQAEFDLVLMERSNWDALHAYRSVSRQPTGFEGVERWLAHFDALGIEQFVLCSFEIRRTAAGRPPVTVRRRAGKELDVPAFDWQFDWGRRLEAPGTPFDRVGTLRPRVVPDARALITLRADADRDWRTVGVTVETDYPAVVAVPAPPVAPTLLELCDGTRDVTAIVAALRANDLLTDEVTPNDVAPLIELLLSAGALEVDECPGATPSDDERLTRSDDERLTRSDRRATRGTSRSAGDDERRLTMLGAVRVVATVRRQRWRSPASRRRRRDRSRAARRCRARSPG